MKQMIISILTIVLVMSVAASAPADDTAIYGANSINVPPNVLIVFDTSGSMGTKDVPADYYDPAKVYTGTFTSTSVYERKWSWWMRRYVYNLFANAVSDLNCAAAVTDLNANGKASLNIQDASGNYECGGGSRALYLGNWLNYDYSSGGTMKTRMDVAQEVITNLLNTTTNVNFGLMRFNGSYGGKLSPNGEIGTATSTLVNDVSNFYASGMTPLAEALAEAGLYYAGRKSWYNSGVTYTSPMQFRCQKNYIILMTDGEPTADDDGRLMTASYVNADGDPIGDYDNDGDTNPSKLLDDVAAYLYQNDINPNLGTAGDSFEMQNIITYTIGFLTNQQLLQDTATNGGGRYFPANSISGLQAAFQEILAEIADVNAVFVSPVVPISRMNRVFAGNFLYIGFFKPQNTGNWLGNIKKYGLNNQGALIDVSGALATLTNGQIKDNAQSYWSTAPDGSDVDEGGVGEMLLNNNARNLYTYMKTTDDLTDADNAFESANTLLTPALMGVTTTTEKNDVIDDIHGNGKMWKMGDVLHSEPAVVHYDTNGDGKLDSSDDAMIFAGTNWGMMQCFRDSDGSEQWGFIPYEQLGRLQNLSDAVTSHDYFADGTPVVYEDGVSNKILMFGERRGSSYYYALDVSTFNSPRWLYKIGPNFLGAGSEVLGQSWGRPQIVKLPTGATTTEDVFLLPGGYDANQDLSVPKSDTVGRAVFSVGITSGTASVFNFNNANFSDMTYSIVDLVGIDPDNDEAVNRIYAPDLGGNMFAYEDDNRDTNWSGQKLFSASALDNVQRKIFYAPDVIKTETGEMIFFGTGDRADPEETGVVNRFYAVKNHWNPPGYPTLNEKNLHDATDDKIQMGNASEKIAAENDLDIKDGWFIKLENPGEKMINAPVVYGKVVYFTTYEPEASSGTPSGDPCDTVGGRGTARLYAVDYLTGAAVNDYFSTDEVDADGKKVYRGKQDRSKIIGTSIPSAPVIAILEGGAKMFVGVEGGVAEEEPVTTFDMNMYYWRELFN